MRRVLWCAAGPALILAACSEMPTAEDFHQQARTATASVVNGVAADAIEINSLQRTPVRATWQAKTPNGVFSCNADERFSLPECLPEGG
jgi:hypothetical protein